MLVRGQLVIATAGGEKGQIFAVADCDGRYAFIIDGKRRKSDNPKRKSIKHLQPTNTVLCEENLTNNKLRKALNKLRNEPAVTN